jgi:hypothetical protein
MSNKIRTSIAALATALFLGAMSTAGALTHSHTTPAPTGSHARGVAAAAPATTPRVDGESITND